MIKVEDKEKPLQGTLGDALEGPTEKSTSEDPLGEEPLGLSDTGVPVYPSEESIHETYRKISRARSRSANGTSKSIFRSSETMEDYWEQVEKRDPSNIKPLPEPVPTEAHSARELRGRRFRPARPKLTGRR